jgi:hypothetical protein
MASVALVLFGVIGYQQLAVREYPDVDPPVVSVSVTLRGANPQVMESAVTDVLEEQLSALEGLRTMTSTSAEQASSITLEFNLDRPVDVAAQDVRDLVSRARGRLPEEIEEPVITKQDADARPFMFVSLTGENYNLLQLSEIADRFVKTPLQSIGGIAQAQVRGETELLFLLDDRDRVQMPTPHTTRKYRNLERRPVATVFFYDQPGWISATGSVELWTGERAAEANQRNRERLLTPGGHQTIGRLLEASENTTIVLTPERWLSWSGRAMMPEIERLGGDLQANPPDTWFRDLG